eukprot:COSAG06_NODE_54721_length_293_cov_0.788660_2_plen_35_part_01
MTSLDYLPRVRIGGKVLSQPAARIPMVDVVPIGIR